MLPDEVGRQRPDVLFKMLDKLNEEEEPDYESMPEHMKMFYGY
jgi:hypothetical protein|nr:MAG TPA: hypothetical protein [Caudoviricetes sp.]